jgi:Arc/MetJ family transcription regulator
MRTNIVIDDELVEKALKLSGKKTKRAVIELALYNLIASLKRREALELKGKVKWSGNLSQMRLH